MLVCVASTNPVKLEATREALIEIGKGWEVKGVEGESGVSAQPWCDETFSGAKARAYKALQNEECEIGLGIEGGVCWEKGKLIAYAVIFAADRDKENFSFSPSFTLPNEIGNLLIKGKELGEATDLIYGKVNSKHKEGAVGVLTNIVDRKRLYRDAIILALYPFYNGKE
ncbi:DUF84 family protein [Metallosphaera hakonensis]|uniref:inosine/xanthosine triphosphatase n=1 Tax=Metallosphaera hakonensis JCM 8857 = DSM 7519 TaxID=1293036 RepID=A0A2U9IWV6_9CREN|nr:inosine/xanthosine triphosphatase [Metallosphaera hakonensis]AWS00525.1 DUF84 family protein [Metallosphaera hakonensis JCM 8857 = DSM 7519]